jgi:nucleoid-associated protein YgaU
MVEIKKAVLGKEPEEMLAKPAAAQQQIVAEHKLTDTETLSHLALKYYGSAAEVYWRVIYEANKALIGPNPAAVKPGMVIKVPVLPDALKKK